MPPYLRAAAATEARAFPIFVHDPAGGSGWGARFSVDGNPQIEADWPLHRFDYEDADLQRISEVVAFSFVDFAALDPRYGHRFAGVTRAAWRDDMLPAHLFLEAGGAAAPNAVPYILMIDDHNVLYRVVVENRLIQAAGRCQETWRRLAQLGGIGEPRIAPPPAAPISQPAPTPAPLPPAAVADTPPAAVADEPPPPPSDAPYIETARCTTCDECTQINNRMFVYDDNKQAHVADPSAGTYRQLVEAAESCQVAIIHPGKPINPDEPNLDDLMARAAPFN